MLYCRVQIEHKHFFIVHWHLLDGPTIYCLPVNAKEQRSVQCCSISLCTQQSQSAGKFFSHGDPQGWFLYSHVYVYCKLQSYCMYLNLDFSRASDFT